MYSRKGITYIILSGCNTVGLVHELYQVTPEPARPLVWVVCTNEVWPSDLAPFLWHHYGTYVQKGDLEMYRNSTRKLLGEYTAHYQRQQIEDEAMREARAAGGKLEESLANAARCSRLDRVNVTAGADADVAML